MSREITLVRGAEALRSCRRPHWVHRFGEVCLDPARSETSSCSETTCREPGDPVCLLWLHRTKKGASAVRVVKPVGVRPRVIRRGKSDRGVVPVKLPNKAGGATPLAAEVVEGRPRAKGNVVWSSTCRTLRRVTGARQFGMRRALLRWRLIVGT